MRGAERPPSPVGPAERDDLALMEGYHSPQLDVAVRLNTNEAPEAPPREFVEALTRSLGKVEWNRYPDRAASELRARVAEREGLAPDQVFAANGSNEVLQTLCLAFGGPGRAAAVFEPTYALHSHIPRTTGTRVVVGERAADFTLDLNEVERVLAEAEPAITFLCSPNNPTGMVEAADTVERVLEEVIRIGGILVVDEAYGQFAARSALSMVADDLPVVVTRTYSKTWSMAAVRLGYMAGPASVVSTLEKVVLPYHLGTMTQIAGIVALDFVEQMKARVAALVEERGRLLASLTELPVEVWPSEANFILFRPLGMSGARVWRELVERSVLVRDCSSWPRLRDCLRVTVGTPEEDNAFLDALSTVLLGGTEGA
ncbi:MAG: Histidinol-phosphate aminotransferase [Acidimicrobiales bacterium]|nr:MAG: histidinol-phosphate transaminase [Actinomycetota bacterium]MBV6509564.1 Histidinol-phosphate aminotransferase [Acidimicrobiales bacterium]RIK06574.1 MAG: histidinol-phosphate transaminase [Acidobacteriota bacterium]